MAQEKFRQSYGFVGSSLAMLHFCEFVRGQREERWPRIGLHIDGRFKLWWWESGGSFLILARRRRSGNNSHVPQGDAFDFPVQFKQRIIQFDQYGSRQIQIMLVRLIGGSLRIIDEWRARLLDVSA